MICSGCVASLPSALSLAPSLQARWIDLRGQVERSHRTDKDEFYQLLTYRDDVDLEKKLAVRERIYNFDRPP
jgi:hypothetical protein